MRIKITVYADDFDEPIEPGPDGKYLEFADDIERGTGLKVYQVVVEKG